jgi:hypothetical protein
MKLSKLNKQLNNEVTARIKAAEELEKIYTNLNDIIEFLPDATLSLETTG